MTDTDRVWVVGEDRLDGRTRLYRAFDNPAAAEKYVDDPENTGNLFVTQLDVEEDYQLA